ncbi:alpha/beta fold hydrolase [Nocardia sp. NBC_01329]|uniref:alpha/beta fold hydrolase n=1 Tax=Nocardia sp. NBC_01329 TaxID=2903594 RepID=UPI002E0D39C5|nr:alpha/beta hydrolase [Nocardia sp. NBC_01329]
MLGTEVEARVSGGVLSGVDFGGEGPGVLLVHGSGHNCVAWSEVASYLVAHCRVVAFDLRGHGHTEADSRTPEQYWRDLGEVVVALGWDRPVLVGHSTGGYAVTAATAAGVVDSGALCVIDGLVLDDRETAALGNTQWREPEAAQRLREMFRYGWRADERRMLDYLEQCARETDTDRLNAGARPELVREVMRRCFIARPDGGYVRRPTVEEIALTAVPDPEAAVYPSVDVYERIECPMTIVLPTDGFYAPRSAEVRAVVRAGRDRRLVDIDSGHNVPMTRPAELAAIIVDLVNRVAAASE